MVLSSKMRQDRSRIDDEFLLAAQQFAELQIVYQAGMFILFQQKNPENQAFSPLWHVPGHYSGALFKVGISGGLLMARPSKPWFRESKNTWYCTQDGKKVSLKVRGRENEKEAIQAWHRLFAGMPLEPSEMPLPPPTVPQVAPTVKAGGVTVREVIDGFLADCEGRAKPRTLRVYRYFFTPFQAKHGLLRASALNCPLVETYARQQAVWSDTSRSAFLSSLATAGERLLSWYFFQAAFPQKASHCPFSLLNKARR